MPIASGAATCCSRRMKAPRRRRVLFETFPFGRRALRFELVPLLERIDATRPRPLVISSIREILQLQQKPEREREMLGWAARWFDAIFVHGDPPLRPLRGYVLVRRRARAAGALHGVRPRQCRGAARDAGCDAQRGRRVGGRRRRGHRAPRNCARRAAALALSRPDVARAGRARTSRTRDCAGCCDIAGPNAIVERSRADFGDLLRRAFISISQAGYNTTLDVIASGARPVVVPFTGNGETEQRARGERLRRFRARRDRRRPHADARVARAGRGRSGDAATTLAGGISTATARRARRALLAGMLDSAGRPRARTSAAA